MLYDINTPSHYVMWREGVQLFVLWHAATKRLEGYWMMSVLWCTTLTTTLACDNVV